MNTFNLELFILQLILIFVLVFIITIILKFNRASRLEKRIGRYSIESIKSNNESIFDILNNKINNSIKSISVVLNKSTFLKNYSKRYDKHILYSDKNRIKSIDYISIKILLITLILLMSIFSNIIKYKPFSFGQFFISVIVGFILPDIFLYLKEYNRKKQIDEDILKAVIIMNSAFKSGRTTVQAIEIVKNELTGPIGDEFKKMYIDISFGLSLDVVFDRFSKRINTDDAKYITASLTVLNKTGGDIVKVFSSIERSFFTRRKLKNELKTLTSSSNLMFKFLIAVPFIIFLLIFVLNPTYFLPLYKTKPGIILSIIIIVIFSLYVYFVKRAMKIKVW